jgi:hypothetical protein
LYGIPKNASRQRHLSDYIRYSTLRPSALLIALYQEETSPSYSTQGEITLYFAYKTHFTFCYTELQLLLLIIIRLSRHNASRSNRCYRPRRLRRPPTHDKCELNISSLNSLSTSCSSSRRMFKMQRNNPQRLRQLPIRSNGAIERCRWCGLGPRDLTDESWKGVNTSSSPIIYIF